MSKQAVVERLLRYGEKLSGEDGWYTDDPAADRFVRNNPNAWLFGVIFDQGDHFERAWKAPYLLKKRLGHFDMHRIARTSVGELQRKIRGQRPGEALLRYVRKMTLWVKRAAKKLVEEYGADASNIWKNCRTAPEVIERLDEFVGIGQKKAHMAARILYEDEGISFLRWRDINIGVDVHVKRVWKRAGLSKDLSVRGIMRAATELNPDYPGALDFPTWNIGSGWCHARRADCRGLRREDNKPCPLLKVCPKLG